MPHLIAAKLMGDDAGLFHTGTGAAAGPTIPLEVRAAALATCRRLLSRMALTACASAVLHPLLRVLMDAQDPLRRDAADTICALALALGPDLVLFVPAIRKVRRLREGGALSGGSQASHPCDPSCNPACHSSCPS